MIKIAIIEDDPTISQMYRMKFESDGFDVRLAANGQIGIEVVEKVSARYYFVRLTNARNGRRGSLKAN